MSVACTLEQVFWAPVHVQLYALYRCSFDINVHICDTFAAGFAHMCISIYVCRCMHMYMDAYVRLWYCLTRWGVVAEIYCPCIAHDMYMHVYTCVHVCVYMCMCICMCMYVCVSVYMCAYTCIYTHVWVYICTRVGAFCLSVLSNPSTTCVCITGVFLTPACVCGGALEVGVFSSLFMVSACCWRGRLCFDRSGVRGFVLYISLFFRVLGWWVGVCLYTRVHTQTTWVPDVSPGVGQTPGEPEEFRSTKAQYTYRPYRCTKYICLYTCWAVDFDDLC